MTWGAPEYAWLLLLLPPAALLRRRLAKWRRLAATRLSIPEPAPPPAWLPLAVLLLLVAALCRPQWGEFKTLERRLGLDILVALDVSRSMLADDLNPSRLTAAKRAIRGLLGRLRGDRIGLIAFAGTAYAVCPLTSDYADFAAMLDAAEDMPLGGSDLTAALREAQRLFAGLPGRGKVLLVLSDGEDHAGGDLAAAARDLRASGVALYAVALGTPTGALIPLPDGDFARDRAGRLIVSRLQMMTLRALGAPVLDLASRPKALEALYGGELTALEGRLDTTERHRLRECFQIPLGLAVLLSLLLQLKERA